MAKIVKPIIILGSPRSGTTFLFTLLSESKELYSLYEESRFIFRDFYLNDKNKTLVDDSLSTNQCSNEEKLKLINNFHATSFKSKLIGLLVNKLLKKKLRINWLVKLASRINIIIKKNKNYRLVEKTPRNAFKVELLNELFPDALFIYIKRDGRSNISSLIEGWKKRELDNLNKSKRLPQINQELNFSNYQGKVWRFTLPPNWQSYINSSLEEVCAFQWKSANDAIREGLLNIDKSRVLEIKYEDLSSKTTEVIKEICLFAGIEFSPELIKISHKAPAVNYFDGKPSFDKWKKNEKEIESISSYISETQKAMGY
jgi:hypothetical protein